MTSDAASGHVGLWTAPKYPGDAVRELLLIRAGELGSVRIQSYDTYLKVGLFVPGTEECSPGDTPKVWPDKHQDTTASPEADNIFDRYVQEAYAAGWQNYHPEQHQVSLKARRHG